MTVFADTFALIAWLNPGDDAHAAVTAYLEGFTGRLVTSEWVLMELADALSAPGARTTCVAFLRAVRADPLFDVIGYVPTAYRGGFDLFATRPDKAWSLTDCISFAIMTERGLSEALTADRHFAVNCPCALCALHVILAVPQQSPSTTWRISASAFPASSRVQRPFF